ncbi:MAG TPA: methyltransferase domain-containing protein [Solirubrobacterales bacterium]|nr:methyltransferase domain-containing protein [Solirubrobacterales bacterium]
MTKAPRKDSALGRALPLLRPEARKKARAAGDTPYLDLLEDDLESTGATQDLMNTGVVPQIYERWWRPALGQVAKGFTGPGMQEEIRIARLLLGLRPGDGVLDVACGPGNFSRAFARVVGDSGLVVGLDASATMLERGASELRRSGPDNLALIRGDATDLPFVDESFDAVCCFAALHLFDDPLGGLDEMTRVLTPGGRIAVMTSVQRKLAPRGPFKPISERLSGMRVFGQDEVAEALEHRGFADIHQRLSGLVQFVGGRLAVGA